MNKNDFGPFKDDRPFSEDQVERAERNDADLNRTQSNNANPTNQNTTFTEHGVAAIPLFIWIALIALIILLVLGTMHFYESPQPEDFNPLRLQKELPLKTPLEKTK